MRSIVNKSLQEGRENLQKVLSGQVSFEDVPTQMQWAKSLEQQILLALTPEQQTAYQAYKREDVAANARLVANGELLSVQNSLGLSQEQQDQVFAVLYNQAVIQLDPDPNTLATQPHNPVSAAELQGKQKLEILQGVSRRHSLKLTASSRTPTCSCSGAPWANSAPHSRGQPVDRFPPGPGRRSSH